MFYFYNRGASVMGYPFASKFCGSSCMNVKFTDSGLSYERVVRETRETEHLFDVESNTRYDIETFNNIISTCDEVTSFALLPRDLGKYPTQALRAILDFNTNSVLDYDMPDDIELYQELTGTCLSESALKSLCCYFRSIWCPAVRARVVTALACRGAEPVNRLRVLNRSNCFCKSMAFANSVIRAKGRLSFLTLTMSPNWGLSERQFSQLFNRWVWNVKRSKLCKDGHFSYVRVGERTEKGVLHFHVLTDVQVSKPKFRDFITEWYALLADFGVKYEISATDLESRESVVKFTRVSAASVRNIQREYKKVSYGSAEHSFEFDFVRMTSLSMVASYISKYMAKLQSAFSEVSPFTCSRDVSAMFTSVPLCCSDDIAAVTFEYSKMGMDIIFPEMSDGRAYVLCTSPRCAERSRELNSFLKKCESRLADLNVRIYREFYSKDTELAETL